MDIVSMIYTPNVIGIITFLSFFTLLWAIYNLFIRPADNNKPHLFGGELCKYPFYVPMFNRDGKLVQEHTFDVWALIHVSIYIITGLFFPSNYLCIFILSFTCEFFEYLIGARARLSDIINNILGYMIGSYLYKYNPIKINLDIHMSKCTIISSIVLLISTASLYYKRSVN
jgi:hypothetical protein